MLSALLPFQVAHDNIGGIRHGGIQLQSGHYRIGRDFLRSQSRRILVLAVEVA